MPLLPSNRKGLGAIIEGTKWSVVDTKPISTMGLAGVLPNLPEFSLEEYLPVENGRQVVLDQGATNSCVAHAFAACIHIAESRIGLPYVPCSRLFAYYNARKAMDTGMVIDTGTFLRTCAAGLCALGVPDEKHWPFSQFTFKVNRRPDFNAMRWAHPRAGGKYVKIFTTGSTRLDSIKAALFSGHAVAFGTQVRQNFLENNASAHIIPSASPIVGGHAMAIIGWKTDVQNVTWFRVLNSWGEKWRDRGRCWFRQDLVMDADADDFHVIYGWKRLQEAAP